MSAAGNDGAPTVQLESTDVSKCQPVTTDFASKERGDRTKIGMISTLSQLCSALPRSVPATRPATASPPARAATPVTHMSTDHAYEHAELFALYCMTCVLLPRCHTKCTCRSPCKIAGGSSKACFGRCYVCAANSLRIWNNKAVEPLYCCLAKLAGANMQVAFNGPNTRMHDVCHGARDARSDSRFRSRRR